MCVRSGPGRSAAATSRIVWHEPQSASRKTCWPRSGGGRGGRRRRLELRRHPGVELLAGLSDDEESHVGVLEAAELGALSAVDAGLIGLQHQGVGGLWEEVELAVQLRHPEAVDDVGRREPQLDGLADGDVQLVGHRDAVFRIGGGPPELVAGDVDLHAAVRRGSGHRAHRQHSHDEDTRQHHRRQHDAEPDDPAGRLARRNLAPVPCLVSPPAQRRHDEQHDDEDEHRCAGGEEDPPQRGDVLRARAGRVQRAR